MAAYAPPRDAFELQVAQIAGATLNMPDLGRRDNLVELGMNRGTAQALARGLYPALGRRTTATRLLAAQTIEAIASLYRDLPKVGHWSSLVELRGGNTSPLVCVHPLGGNAFWYLPLARKIGGSQSIYGLHSRGLDLTEQVQTSIAEMAESYVADLRSIVPNGPYALLGWSFGGAVAFEMARQLSREDVVSFVAMCDVGPDDVPGTPDSADAAFGLLVHAVRYDDAAARLMAMPETERIRALHQMCVDSKRLPPGYTCAQLERMLAINHANLHAMRTYRFGPYNGHMIIFRSAERDDGKISASRSEDLGWREHVSGRITVEPIGGSHFDALSPANINVIAKYLKEHLR